MAARSELARPFQLWAIGVLSACSYPPHGVPKFTEMMRRKFSAWNNSRVNEEANKLWKDGQRDSTSKVIGIRLSIIPINTLYIIHYTLYVIHYALYIMHYALYILQYTLYIIHYTVYIIH